MKLKCDVAKLCPDAQRRDHWFVGGQPATVALDDFICEGLMYCLYSDESSYNNIVKITRSLFLHNYRAIYYHNQYNWDFKVKEFSVSSSIFFRNCQAISLSVWYCMSCIIEDCLFLQNDDGIVGEFFGSGAPSARYLKSTFAQNVQAVSRKVESYNRGSNFEEILFYQNEFAYSDVSGYQPAEEESFWQNVTFLDNHISMFLRSSLHRLQRINFLAPFHIYYIGTLLYDLSLSLTFWNTTSEDDVEAKTYHAIDGSGQGLVRFLDAESMPSSPFLHQMYQADPCAGQCVQNWFNTNWSKLIRADAGTFGLYDVDQSLSSGQSLRDALLSGHHPTNMSLSMYMQDLIDLFDAVGAYQTAGTTTSRLPSTTPGTTLSTATTTTTPAKGWAWFVAEALGAGVHPTVGSGARQV